VASEMRGDLKRLKRELDSGRSSSVSVAAPVDPTPSAHSVGAPPPSASTVQPASAISGPVSAPPVFAAPTSRMRWYIAPAALIVAALAIGGFFHKHGTRALTEKDSI